MSDKKEDGSVGGCEFINERGDFVLRHADRYSGLYFPLAGERGVKSSVTPVLGGDMKTDQNHFLLEPVSVSDLHESRSGRNFWCVVEGRGVWSATGVSAAQAALRHGGGEEDVTLRAGLLWQSVTRRSETFGLEAEILSFAETEDNAEVHRVRLTNTGRESVTLRPLAAVPVYGRSADNIRDHRHVTSLLHRAGTDGYGVWVCPTLSFDERGHTKNDTVYAVQGMDGDGAPPESYYIDLGAFIGEGGQLDWPEAVVRDLPGVGPGCRLDGQEIVGGLRFAKITLAPGESREYVLVLSISERGQPLPNPRQRYENARGVARAWERVCGHWQSKVNVRVHTGDPVFDSFMVWVAVQPELRRLFGCSFLPHHDYGRGGRGWRDLWQDCLALLLMDPAGVGRMLLDNFAGVRVDGTNATIIGDGPGQFKADRNAITRVWMDHGVWPCMTVKLYIDQTGDLELLNRQAPYFKDRQVRRGTAADGLWRPDGLWQTDEAGELYRGTVLEHLLAQNLTAFYEVGEHNHIRLRDADWNDALDLAGHRGESVAFSNAYGKNLLDLAALVERCAARGQDSFPILEEMTALLAGDEALYEDAGAKRQVLADYLTACEHTVSGRLAQVDSRTLAAALREKGLWLLEHIRRTEWVTDSRGHGWYNGYYDDNGRALEGERDGRSHMMLTSQVFSVMAGTATPAQVRSIADSADAYLYDGGCGGYRLNTDFGQVKTDMGRMFGFAYGEKENGAVFSHMAVMFANALYSRGFAAEGHKALDSLYRQAMDFEKSRVYPGVPEYFGRGGRGLYHYLTGAASWYLLTVVQQVFGVRGEQGALTVRPGLLSCQLDGQGMASLELSFADRRWHIRLHRPLDGEAAESPVGARLDGAPLSVETGAVTVPPETIRALDSGMVHTLDIYWKGATA